jgi:diguanylate cyclase (GGDEF)-like protein
MEKLVDTIIQKSEGRPVSNNRDACLIHIYPTGPLMGMRQVLSDRPLIIGRGEDCDIRLLDTSVSRRHVRLERINEEYFVLDMQSTNGTYVNDVPSRPGEPLPLKDGDYLRVGNCIFRYLAGGNVEADYHEEIYRLTIIDALTQIHNTRYFHEFLEREILRTLRHKRPLSLVLFDIDRFKGINDQLGHLGGDFTLRELAAVVRKTLRREDLFARYGGEEFAMVLVETPGKQAVEVAERVRVLVEKHSFHFDSKVFHLTISLGVAECPLDGTASARELIRLADERLYEAKRTGRNRVVGEQPGKGEPEA